MVALVKGAHEGTVDIELSSEAAIFVKHRKHNLGPSVIVASNVVFEQLGVLGNHNFLQLGTRAALSLTILDRAAGEYVIVAEVLADVDVLYVSHLGVVEADKGKFGKVVG